VFDTGDLVYTCPYVHSVIDDLCRFSNIRPLFYSVIGRGRINSLTIRDLTRYHRELTIRNIYLRRAIWTFVGPVKGCPGVVCHGR